ncbi:MAG TPA: hypothetical protein VEW46_18320 [Pyrinomonadaceae bacterium]|nr:hypothetical protein [Pyrinomonadaceae bacterium]
MFTSSHSSLDSYFLRTLFGLSILAVGFIWPLTALAQGLVITPAPVVIATTDPVQLTIKKGADTLSGDAAKFSAPDDAIVSFDPATLKVTPKKSGKTKLTITYKENETAPAVRGEVDVIVRYKSATIAPTLVESGRTWEILGGQKVSVRTSDVILKDLKNDTSAVAQEVEFVPADPALLVATKATTAKAGEIKAQPVKGVTETNVVLKVDGVEYPPIKIKVIEAVTGFSVLLGGRPIAPQDGLVKISIPEGEKRILEVKPVGRQDKIKDLKNFSFTLPDPPNLLTITPKDDNFEVAANVTGATTTDTSRMTFIATNQDVVEGVPSDARLTVEFQIPRKTSYIELQTPQGSFLTRNGKVTVRAAVRNKATASALSSSVAFELFEKEKNKVWVTLTQEGDTATVFWRDPSESDIRAHYGGELVTRPTEVVVTATATVGTEKVESQVTLRMAEVSKFAKLKVKLNIMDERTASDLYSSVMSNEYYVLTVRLFNNLKDEETREYIGSSILAYSASIEVAVELEKKFDRKSGTAVPGLIRKDAAKRVADLRSDTVERHAINQATRDLAFARSSSDDLQNAGEEEQRRYREVYSLFKEIETLAARVEDLRRDPPQSAELKAAETQYVDLYTKYQLAIGRAQKASEALMSIRENIARAAYRRRPITQALDGDTTDVYDDGLWHRLTRDDLNIIQPGQPPAEMGRGLFPKARRLEDLSRTVESGLTVSADRRPTEPEVIDPPCIGTITYRPFTFEMMVNTVDRRDERGRRSKIFRLLDFVGTATSYVTAVAVPGSSSDLPLGLEKFRNLLIPGLDRIFPNHKEQQRQNIVSQAMKEIEEIPFGSDITRVIFIPKKNIRGLLSGHDLRISEICPFYFSVDVAIIQKGRETVQQGAVTR